MEAQVIPSILSPTAQHNRGWTKCSPASCSHCWEMLQPAQEKHPAQHTKPCPVFKERGLCPQFCPALAMWGDAGCISACPFASSRAASHEEYRGKRCICLHVSSHWIYLLFFLFFMNGSYFFLGTSCQRQQRRRETSYNVGVSKSHPLLSEKP